MTILAEGTIPAIQGILFPSDPVFSTSVLDFEKVIIEKITMFNTNTTSQIVKLFVKKKFGTVRSVRRFVLEGDDCGEYLEPGEVLSLDPGDDIEGLATDADVVQFIIYGELV